MRMIVIRYHVLALPAFLHADLSGIKLQVQQNNAIASGRLAVGSRQINYISKTRPRTPQV
ncbi:MAG: hypothetical protein PSV46_13560 [Reyranella sp.]|nr:hypothetical protein [Reyranella sp.]